MKRTVTIAAVLLLISAAYVPAGAFDIASHLGVGVQDGIAIPTNGDITADSTVADFFKVGPLFGGHINYAVNDAITIRTGFDYAFMKMEDAAKDDPAKDPYWTTPYVYLDGVFNLGSLFKNPSNIFNPYVGAGAGLYFWKVTDDNVNGDPVLLSNNEEFKKTSFGLNFTGGVEVFATSQFSFFAEGKYHLVFASDDAKFGTDIPTLDNIGFIGITGGVSYYFPLTSK